MQNSQQVGRDFHRILDTDSLPPTAQKAYLEAIEPFDRALIQRQLLRESEVYCSIRKDWDEVPNEDPEIQDLFRDPDWNNESFNHADVVKEDHSKIKGDNSLVESNISYSEIQEPQEALG